MQGAVTSGGADTVRWRRWYCGGRRADWARTGQAQRARKRQWTGD